MDNILKILLLLLVVLQNVQGDILRCHCNGAACVSTSYMCKGSLCFNDARGLQGCLQGNFCPRSVRCCDRDMCNSHHLPTDSSFESSEEERVALLQESSQPGVTWFRAAVIAVPVCGAGALALLACAARRLLRRDRRRLMRLRAGQPLIIVPWGKEKCATVV